MRNELANIFTKDEFIMFCELYQLENGLSYDEEQLQHVSENHYIYIALFRDEYNYKIETIIAYNDGAITIEEPFFYNDETEDTKPLFHSFNDEVFTKFKKLIAAKRRQQGQTS
ncbi:hypothetical protein CN918_28445 [Priestia megaterium]|nr:hypothetical protein CN918_28445 [Priestia megaterium]